MSDTWTRKRILNVLGLLVLIAIVLPFLIYAVPGAIGADASHVVLSGSMAPAIEAGDVVIVRDVPAQTIEEGDVITFETPTGGLPTTHRVTEVQGSGADLAFQTKGDANEDADPERISPAEVNGKVIGVIPFIGHVILFATTPLGLVVFLGLPFGLLIVSEAWVFAKEASGKSAREASDGSGDGASGSLLASVPGAKAAGVASGGQQESDHTAGRSGDPRHSSAATEPAGESLEDDTGSDSFTITPADLQISLAITGLFFTYALWMFYQQWFVSDRQSAVPVAALVGTTAALLILLGLYYGAEHHAEEDEGVQETDRSTVVANGGQAHSRMGAASTGTVASDRSDTSRSNRTAPGGIESSEAETVPTMGDLVAIANETRTPIEWRPWENSLELAPPAEVYVMEVAEQPFTRADGDSPETPAARNGDTDLPDGEEDADTGSDGIPPGEPADSASIAGDSTEPAAGESEGGSR